MRVTLILALCSAPLGAQQPPRIMEFYRDSLKRGSDSAFRAIENDAAQVCADLKCPNPYLAIESLSGMHEAWWLNAFASEADTTRVVNAYAANPPLLAALGRAIKGKEVLVGTPVNVFGVYRADRSHSPPWNVAGARFLVVTVTRTDRAIQGTEWDAADGTRYILRAVPTEREAQALAIAAGAGTRVFAIRPNWSMPAPEWRAADPEFWKVAPVAHR